MSAPQYHIRSFEVADTDAVIALWQATQLVRSWNDPHKDIQRKLEQLEHSQTSIFWVIEMDGEIIGSVMAGYDGHRASVNYLAVHPKCQTKGIGRIMMDKVEQWCLTLNCPKINLLVRTDNLDVRNFYAQLGYAQDEVVALSKRLIPDQ